MRRFYHNSALTIGQKTTLAEGNSHHISRVLRLEPDTEIIVFDGSSGEWRCLISEVSRKAVAVMPLAFESILRTPVAQATLVLPIIKGDRMDVAIQKATELGVHCIQLVHTRYTDVRLNAERLDKKLNHWQQIIISAAEQCGLNVLPELLPVVPFENWLATHETSLGLIAHPGQTSLKCQLPLTPCNFTLLTGPEGGFHEDEVAAAIAKGFKAATLGERILRAETAPTALLSAIWALWADN